MIEISNKQKCCGCSACIQACPTQCMSFNEDEQGFCYPLVDKDRCIDCGLCEKVCPSLNQIEKRKPQSAYAAINPNEEIRMKSSSGGIFTMLADRIIKDGGVVFGARFNETWEVIHDFTETEEGLEPFRGSKYVQSRIGETYKQAKVFLDGNRKVLFTGTPCQIAGLKKYLRKEYDNLLTVDVVCHGVPSPLVWREYLKNRLPGITHISFRDKSTGWKKYSVVISGKTTMNSEEEFVHETYDKNIYMQVFLKNLCLRPSCHNCPAKSGKSGSDITIADYWGAESVQGIENDDKGISLVLANCLKGDEILNMLHCRLIETSYEAALIGNPSLVESAKVGKYYDLFWNSFHGSGFDKIENLMKKYSGTLVGHVAKRIRSVISNTYHKLLKR